MKLKSRKFWLTVASIIIAVVTPLWVHDSAIYAALVAFLAANCGLYGYNANTATRNHFLQELAAKDD